MNLPTSDTSVQAFFAEPLLAPSQVENFVNPSATLSALNKHAKRTGTYAKELSGALRTHGSSLQNNARAMSEKQTQAFSGAVQDFASHSSQSDLGGYPEAVIRILILLARARKSVRRDRLDRSNEILTMHEPFASLGLAARNRLIHQQGLCVEFEPELALSSLAQLLPETQDRVRAIDTCEFVVGVAQDMSDDTQNMFNCIRQVLAVAAPVKPKGRTRARAEDDDMAVA